MESEKVKEILEIFANDNEPDGTTRICREALALINELESENERLSNTEIGELIKENEELAKQCEDWREITLKKRNQIIELKDRIAFLETDNETLRDSKEIYENIDYCLEDLKKAEKKIAELENIGLNEKTTVGEYLREMERLKAELEKEQINNLNCDTELQYKEKRIAELEKVNDRQVRIINDLNIEVVKEQKKLSKFAERLIEKCEWNRKQYCCSATVSANDIDETLKEFL